MSALARLWTNPNVRERELCTTVPLPLKTVLNLSTVQPGELFGRFLCKKRNGMSVLSYDRNHPFVTCRVGQEKDTVLRVTMHGSRNSSLFM